MPREFVWGRRLPRGFPPIPIVTTPDPNIPPGQPRMERGDFRDTTEENKENLPPWLAAQLESGWAQTRATRPRSPPPPNILNAFVPGYRRNSTRRQINAEQNLVQRLSAISLTGRAGGVSRSSTAPAARPRERAHLPGTGIYTPTLPESERAPPSGGAAVDRAILDSYMPANRRRGHASAGEDFEIYNDPPPVEPHTPHWNLLPVDDPITLRYSRTNQRPARTALAENYGQEIPHNRFTYHHRSAWAVTVPVDVRYEIALEHDEEAHEQQENQEFQIHNDPPPPNTNRVPSGLQVRAGHSLRADQEDISGYTPQGNDLQELQARFGFRIYEDQPAPEVTTSQEVVAPAAAPEVFLPNHVLRAGRPRSATFPGMSERNPAFRAIQRMPFGLLEAGQQTHVIEDRVVSITASESRRVSSEF